MKVVIGWIYVGTQRILGVRLIATTEFANDIYVKQNMVTSGVCFPSLHWPHMPLTIRNPATYAIIQQQ